MMFISLFKIIDMKDQVFLVGAKMANAITMQIRITKYLLMTYLTSLQSQMRSISRSPISMNCPRFIKYFLSMELDSIMKVIAL